MAAIMQMENPGNPRMETRLGFGIGIGLDFWLYVTLVRTARGASRRAGVRYKLWKTNEHTILKLWTLIKNIIERTHTFPYNILFTFLMDCGRAPNGIGHFMILTYDIIVRILSEIKL